MARVFEGDVWATKVNTSDDFDKALKVTQIMNKMCYIEAITDKLDAPALLSEFANSTVNGPEKTQLKETAENNADADDLVLTESGNGFEYETVVHKGIAEYNNNEISEEITNG